MFLFLRSELTIEINFFAVKHKKQIIIYIYNIQYTKEDINRSIKKENVKVRNIIIDSLLGFRGMIVTMYVNDIYNE